MKPDDNGCKRIAVIAIILTFLLIGPFSTLPIVNLVDLISLILRVLL